MLYAMNVCVVIPTTVVDVQWWASLLHMEGQMSEESQHYSERMAAIYCDLWYAVFFCVWRWSKRTRYTKGTHGRRSWGVGTCTRKNFIIRITLHTRSVWHSIPRRAVPASNFWPRIKQQQSNFIYHYCTYRDLESYPPYGCFNGFLWCRGGGVGFL